MFKVIVFAMVAIAAVNATSFSPALQTIKDASSAHLKARSLLNQAFSKLNSGSVRLMQEDDDICANEDAVRQMAGFTTAQCLEQGGDANFCNCELPLYKALLPVILISCEAGCKDVFTSLESAPDDANVEQYTQSVCPNRGCFSRFFAGLRSLDNVVAPSTCPASGLSQFTSVFQSFEDVLDFYCSKGTDGQYCGDKWEAQTTKVDSCSSDSVDCVCGGFASLGCCTKNALVFLNKTSAMAASEFTNSMEGLCNYTVSSMPECPNNRAPTLKVASAMLKFKAVKCGQTSDAVAYMIQKQTSTVAEVPIGDVSVVIDQCECCSSTSRRLLSTGAVSASVTLSGDSATEGTTKLNTAVSAGTFSNGNDDLGAIDSSESSEARVTTQESDLQSPAAALSPSLLIAAILAAVALL
jgi:hypothetical protein